MTAGLAFLGSFCAVLLLGAPARAALTEFGFLDRPNARSSHATPTVRGGGVAFVVAIASAMIAYAVRTGERDFAAFALAMLVLAAASFVDDARGLSVRIRLVVQTLVAVAPSLLALSADGIEPTARLTLFGVALVGTVGFTNAVNFMDGINGIVTIHAVVAFVGTAAIAHRTGLPDLVPLVLGMAGATLGFLPWNFPRARMFMGDVGSASLGYVLAVLVVRIACDDRLGTVLSFAMIHAGFVLDTGITLARRALRGERLGEAHREHFYQRFLRSGASHARVALAYGAMTLAGTSLAVGVARSSFRDTALAFALVVTAWLVFFRFVEIRFEASPERSASR